MIIRSPPLGSCNRTSLSIICTRCLGSIPRTSAPASSRPFSSVWGARNPRPQSNTLPRRLRPGYFVANGLSKSFQLGLRGESSSSGSATYGAASIEAVVDFRSHPPPTSPTPPSPSETLQQDLPHRRRQARKQAQKATTGPEIPSEQLPLDASAVLGKRAAELPVHSFRRACSTFLSLAKPRLSALIILTTTSAYSLYPVPELLNPSLTNTPSLSVLTLLFLTTGTALTCASANALNMLYEPKTDALMSRTRNRPLVRGLISSRGALIFAVVSGAAGIAALYYGTNPTVAFLGGLNIFFYAGMYTPLKPISAINTWVGAVVGAVPPLMGWAAAAGQTATGSGDWRELLLGESNYGGWVVAALLFAWQFPHFMALSWNNREDYKRAGLRMLCWTNPARNARVALRYSIAMFPICLAFPYVGVTDWIFAATSLPLNVWLLRAAWKFYQHDGAHGTARPLFWASVWHMPGVLVLAMVQKKGMMSRIYRAIVGAPDDTEDDLDYVK